MNYEGISTELNLVGLSTDDKPDDVKNGSTFYEVDTSTLYVYYEGVWYEQE